MPEKKVPKLSVRASSAGIKDAGGSTDERRQSGIARSPQYRPAGRQSFQASSHLIKARTEDEFYNLQPLNTRAASASQSSATSRSTASHSATSHSAAAPSDAASQVSILEHKNIIDSSALFRDVMTLEEEDAAAADAASDEQPVPEMSSSVIDMTSNEKSWVTAFVQRSIRQRQYAYLQSRDLKLRRQAVMRRVAEDDDEETDFNDSSTTTNLTMPAGKPVHFPAISKPAKASKQRKPSAAADTTGQDGQKKFKALVARLGVTSKAAREQKQRHRKHFEQEEGIQPLLFCKSDFSMAAKAYGKLTQRARATLSKPAAERTDEELSQIYDVVDRLKCLSRYSRKVKHDLAKVMRYEVYNCGRVLIKEGHKAEEFYLIVSGSVNMLHTEHMRSGQSRQRIVGTLDEGQCFGELELLYEMKRNATYVVRDPGSEFFCISKHDFQQVLYDSHEAIMNEKLDILLREDATKDWPYEDLTGLSSQCKLVEFASEKIILGNTNGDADVICHIVSGKCRLVRELYLVKIHRGQGRHSFRLATERDMEQSKLKSRRYGLRGGITIVERHLWTISTIGQGTHG